MTKPKALKNYSAKFNDYLLTLPGNTVGAIFNLLAGIFFTCVMIIVKYIPDEFSVFQILLIRQITMGLLLFCIFPRNFFTHLKTQNLSRHIIRVLCASIALGGWFFALRHLPLADVTAIGFSKAMFTTLFAILILHEVVGKYRISALILGFIGVLVIVQPGTSGFSIYGLSAVTSAAAAGFVMVLLRQMTRSDSTITIILYQVIFLSLIMLPFAAYLWHDMNFEVTILMLLLGFFALISQAFNVLCYKYGEASAMAGFDYARMIYSIIAGYLIFNETIGWQTILGSMVIVTASAITLWREHYLKKQIIHGPQNKTPPLN